MFFGQLKIFFGQSNLTPGQSPMIPLKWMFNFNLIHENSKILSNEKKLYIFKKQGFRNI